MPRHVTIAKVRRPRAGGGFTVVELIAVMVMMAILVGVAVPSLSSFGDTRPAMAAQHLLRDITFARQHAVATGTITWVRFDTTGDTSWSIRAETGTPGKANAVLVSDPATGGDFTQTLNQRPFQSVKVLTAVFTGDDTNDYEDVGFDWLGQPLTADGVVLNALGTVTLTGSYKVNVHPETGFVDYVQGSG